MEFFNFNPNTIFSFLLTLFRVSILVFLLPFFGGETLPKSVKGAFCFVLALGVWPLLSFPGSLFPKSPLMFAIMMVGEIIIGLVLGLTVRIIFGAIQTGGQLIGFQMGFTMINAVDPLTGEQTAVTSHLLYMISLLIFMSLNGHLVLLRGLTLSFALVPPGGVLVTPALTQEFLGFSAQLFILAVKIAIPIMAAMFLVDLGLALISRAAPQMNVLVIGFPLKIGIGFMFLGILLTFMSRFIQDFIINLDVTFKHFLSLMK